MPVTSDFIVLANDLVIRGYSNASSYINGVSTQPTFYIVLLDNGSVVAQLPVSQFSYREFSPNEQSLTYTAIDNSNNQYTFNEVQLWAGNQYIITDDILSKPVTKDSSLPLTVTVVVTLSTSTNTTSKTALFVVGGVTKQIPACDFWGYTYCNVVYTPMPIQNFIILLLLIPSSYYSQLQNTLFIQTYNQLPLNANNPLESIKGVTLIAVAVPLIYKQNITATTQVNCTTLTPNTPFLPPFKTSEALVGAFEQVETLYIAFITIATPLNTTQYVEFEVTTVVST